MNEIIEARLPATKQFLFRSFVERLSIKTSASSIRRTAPQLEAVLNSRMRTLSTVLGSAPISLLVRTINGRCVYSAMHSWILDFTSVLNYKFVSLDLPAVHVFPTPGLPWRRKICPWPLPWMKSALQGGRSDTSPCLFLRI